MMKWICSWTINISNLWIFIKSSIMIILNEENTFIALSWLDFEIKSLDLFLFSTKTFWGSNLFPSANKRRLLFVIHLEYTIITYHSFLCRIEHTLVILLLLFLGFPAEKSLGALKCNDMISMYVTAVNTTL